MKNFMKLVKITMTFLLFMLALSLLWYGLEHHTIVRSDTGNSYYDFLMYLLGYSDITGVSSQSRLFFAVVSLLALTLLASVFTVRLFQWVSKIRLSDKIIICHKQSNNGVDDVRNDGEQYAALLCLETGKRDVFNVEYELIESGEEKSVVSSYNIPYLSGGQVRILEFPIVLGSEVYRYLRSVAKNNQEVLLMKVSYTDIEAGEDYTVCQKYLCANKKSQFVFSDALSSSLKNKLGFTAAMKSDCAAVKSEVFDYVARDRFPIALSSGIRICSEYIQVDYQESMVKCAIGFTDEKVFKEDDFCMFCIKQPLGGDWTAYYDMNCMFTVEIAPEADTVVTLEIKGENNIKLVSERIEHDPNHGKIVQVLLNQFSREQLGRVEEICFTVFYPDVSQEDKRGGFSVAKCALETCTPQ